MDYSRTVDKDVVYYNPQKNIMFPGVMLLHRREKKNKITFLSVFVSGSITGGDCSVLLA